MPEQSVRSLSNTNVAEAKDDLSDAEIYGDGDTWVLICKFSSKKAGIMKSTKALQVGTGCLVQVTTKEGGKVAEAVTFVPGVKIDRTGPTPVLR